jgi:hypothetical protein
MFYVDDRLVAERSAAEAEALVEQVGSIFEIMDISEPKDFLGIEISRDLALGTITISQESTTFVLAKQLVVNRSRRALSMSPETYAGLRAAQRGEPKADKLEYQEVVGSLLHQAQCTHPDIGPSVSTLAAYTAAPSAPSAPQLCYTSSGTFAAPMVTSGSLWGCSAMQTLHARKHGGAPQDGGAPQVGLSPCTEEPSHEAARSRPPR